MNSLFSCYPIGLSGPIASGKSSVSQIFQQLGCAIVDADIVARQVVLPHTKGLKMLAEVFGKEILNDDLTLNRAKLREIVFENNNNREKINAILHPIIQREIIEQVQLVKNQICIVVIPLLCESNNHYDWLNRTLIVDVSHAAQLSRLLKRDDIDKDLASKMIKSQCRREKRLLIADDVINNEQSLEQLAKNVKKLYRLYKNF